jgi:hypothetical protein
MGSRNNRRPARKAKAELELFEAFGRKLPVAIAVDMTHETWPAFVQLPEHVGMHWMANSVNSSNSSATKLIDLSLALPLRSAAFALALALTASCFLCFAMFDPPRKRNEQHKPMS